MAAAGAVSRTATAPLDRLKVLMQAAAGTSTQESRSIVQNIIHMHREGGQSQTIRHHTHAISHTRVHALFSIRHDLMRVLEIMVVRSGFGAFWRGNGANVIKIAPESAIKFLAYDRIKQVRNAKSQSLHIASKNCPRRLR